MNALELAEERARNPWMEPECNAEDFEKLAITLRQQQAEIEALKVKAHEWYLIAMEKAQEK
jgi:U3 small nucleolar ribonucleoprotein component